MGTQVGGTVRVGIGTRVGVIEGMDVRGEDEVGVGVGTNVGSAVVGLAVEW